VDKDEQIVALDVAARFDMDEAESLVALKTVHEGRQADKLTEDDWHSLTAYVFEERRAVIAIVQWLIRIRESSL
jgi:nuclear pore complex protein Nup188